MKEFTRFENQYILMLAGRARQQLQEEIKDNEGYDDEFTQEHIKTLKGYVDALESIGQKAGHNMKEWDKRGEKE